MSRDETGKSSAAIITRRGDRLSVLCTTCHKAGVNPARSNQSVQFRADYTGSRRRSIRKDAGTDCFLFPLELNLELQNGRRTHDEVV